VLLVEVMGVKQRQQWLSTEFDDGERAVLSIVTKHNDRHIV
jgi:hypothetical protein